MFHRGCVTDEPKDGKRKLVYVCLIRTLLVLAYVLIVDQWFLTFFSFRFPASDILFIVYHVPAASFVPNGEEKFLQFIENFQSAKPNMNVWEVRTNHVYI